MAKKLSKAHIIAKAWDPKTYSKRKHRIKMEVDFQFGYEDQIGLLAKDRLSTEEEILKDLRKDLRKNGLSEFIKACDHNPKIKVKFSFIK